MGRRTHHITQLLKATTGSAVSDDRLGTPSVGPAVGGVWERPERRGKVRNFASQVPQFRGVAGGAEAGDENYAGTKVQRA